MVAQTNAQVLDDAQYHNLAPDGIWKKTAIPLFYCFPNHKCKKCNQIASKSKQYLPNQDYPTYNSQNQPSIALTPVIEQKQVRRLSQHSLWFFSQLQCSSFL